MPLSRNTKNGIIKTLHIAVHVVAFICLLRLVQLTFSDGFGGEPVPGMEHFVGIGAFRLLLLSLCITPLAKFFKLPLLIKLRRPLGLWCFAYATLHFAIWIVLDLQFAWAFIGEEIIKRNYLLIGFAAWAILIPLAITSIPKLQRKMGSAWKKLHHWVYLVAVLVSIHYLWSVKSEIIEPSIYMAISFALLAYRYKTFLKPFKKLTSKTA